MIFNHAWRNYYSKDLCLSYVVFLNTSTQQIPLQFYQDVTICLDFLLFLRCDTNHQYRAQGFNVHAYSDRQQTTNTVHNISTFMPIQNGNKPPIPCTTSQRSCLFRTATNHQYCAQHLQRSCLFRTATNHQYHAQHLKVHAYLERQRTVNTMHNVSTFLPI